MGAFQNITILGAGSWGTALAVSTHRAGRDVAIWGRDMAIHVIDDKVFARKKVKNK